jgi:hypothetical protein
MWQYAAAKSPPEMGPEAAVCGIYGPVVQTTCPSFTIANATSVTDISGCPQAEMARVLLNTFPISELLGETLQAPFEANDSTVSSTSVSMEGTVLKIADTAIIGAALRAPLRAANYIECLDLCANWIEMGELVVVGALFFTFLPLHDCFIGF